MKNISILLPTRKRPNEFLRMMTSASETADDPEGLEFIAYIDNDDTSYDIFQNITFIRGKRIVLSQMWNECQKKADADIYMHAGDDLVFRTRGWDSMVLNAFQQYKDRIVFVNGTDGAPEGTLPTPTFGTHGFLHRNWVNVVGYFVPPYFSSDYNDTWLNEVADSLDRHIYLPEVLTEHMHWTFGKAEIDENTRDRIARHHKDNVQVLYATLADKRREDVEKLKKFIDSC